MKTSLIKMMIDMNKTIALYIFFYDEINTDGRKIKAI